MQPPREIALVCPNKLSLLERSRGLMMAVKKISNGVDAAVGQRIRLFRINAGISQMELGNQIGVTFQQVQKYEKGANRVGAGRLADIANVLGVSIDMLFPESTVVRKTNTESMPVELLTGPHALHALQAFSVIPDKRLRQLLVQLLEHLSTYSTGRVG